MSLDLHFYAVRETEVASFNITHNLGAMAREAGIYGALWRPEEHPEYQTAGDIVPVLEAGLAAMKADPERFKAFNAPNGWGMYHHFVPWVEEVLAACKKNPDARLEASR